MKQMDLEMTPGDFSTMSDNQPDKGFDNPLYDTVHQVFFKIILIPLYLSSSNKVMQSYLPLMCKKYFSLIVLEAEWNLFPSNLLICPSMFGFTNFEVMILIY
jgi:hypothetical protein